MRTERDELQKTHITSLAAATGIVVFVAWMVSFAMPHDSIFTRDLIASPPAAVATNQAQVEVSPNLD